MPLHNNTQPSGNDYQVRVLEDRCNTLQEQLGASEMVQHNAALGAQEARDSAAASVAGLKLQLDAAQLAHSVAEVTIAGLRQELELLVDTVKEAGERLEKNSGNMLVMEKRAEVAEELLDAGEKAAEFLQVRRPPFTHDVADLIEVDQVPSYLCVLGRRSSAA